jgi:MFS family permease
MSASDAARPDPYAAFRHRNFRLYAAGNFLSVIGRQMLDVALGWEMYQRTHSPAMLGFIGLAAGLPIILFAVPAGHLADRISRRLILLVNQLVTASSSLGLMVVSLTHAPVGWLFGLIFLSSTSRAFGWTARSAMVPNLVPSAELNNAVTWSAGMFQSGAMVGPAVGGFLIARFGFPVIYGLDVFAALSFFCLLCFVRPNPAPASSAPREKGWRQLFSGLRFVWNTKVVLGIITLDLFAVMFGGATALLPIFADKILHCGPISLGWMRAAPSIGALTMSLLVAHLPPMQKSGRTMLRAVAGFGLVTVIFGLSSNLWLSIAMLFFTGAFDTLSVVVRHTVVQLLTPDAMRGRVSAVNNVFIGSSNEIGAFESGITAAWLGPVASVILGGVASILVVFACASRWPQILKLGPLNRMKSGDQQREEGSSPA